MQKPSPRSFALPEGIPFHELDERYFAHAAQLEPPLDTLALNRQLFAGGGEAGQITSLREVYPLATCIPWLFNEAFPAVFEMDLLDIAEAGMLLILAAILYDHYLDGQLPSQPGILLLLQRLHTAGLRKFHTLFEAQSQFWNYFDHYLHQSTMALLRETEHHCGRVTAYSVEMMWEIGSGKAALLKTVTSALALKAGAEPYIPCLETALDASTAALQLGDDIEDWWDDYQHQKYTLPLTMAIPIEEWPVPSLSAEEIGQRLENSVILETLLEQVIEWFQQALDAVVALHCPYWVEFVKDRLALCQHYRRIIVSKKLRKLLEPATREKVRTSAGQRVAGVRQHQ